MASNIKTREDIKYILDLIENSAISRYRMTELKEILQEKNVFEKVESYIKKRGFEDWDAFSEFISSKTLDGPESVKVSGVVGFITGATGGSSTTAPSK